MIHANAPTTERQSREVGAVQSTKPARYLQVATLREKQNRIYLYRFQGSEKSLCNFCTGPCSLKFLTFYTLGYLNNLLLLCFFLRFLCSLCCDLCRFGFFVGLYIGLIFCQIFRVFCILCSTSCFPRFFFFQLLLL